MYVPEIQPKWNTSAKVLGPLYSPFSCGVQYQVSLKSGNEKIIKNQFPIQSSTLWENLINANNVSGIVRWSYLFFLFEMFFYQPLSQWEPNGLMGHLVYY